MSRERLKEGPRKTLELEDYIKTSPSLTNAYYFGKQAHEGQKRASGEDYFDHCVAVAKILFEEWGIDDENIISAAFLHDTTEDTNITLDDLVQVFGEDTAYLVDGVSQFRSEDGNDLNLDKSTRDRETIKKVFGRSYIDPRVAVLKLADRLHNMRTLNAVPEAKRRAKALETRDVYARLAESLGMWKVKIELEDLAFSYIDPDNFLKIKEELDNDPRRSEAFKEHLKSSIEQILEANGISATVATHENGYWALYKKRRRATLQGRSLPDSFETINDVMGIRISTDNATDSWRIIGLIHENFSDIVDRDRFDEFLTLPRDNGYSVLQTTLDFAIGSVEIATTTSDREEFNHWGIVSLIRKRSEDLSKFTLKLVFTPSGVWFLRKMATGLDLAITMDPVNGPKVKRVIINGEKKTASSVLGNSDEVKICWPGADARVEQMDVMYVSPALQLSFEKAMIQQERTDYINTGKQAVGAMLSKHGLLELIDVPFDGFYESDMERATQMVRTIFPEMLEVGLDNLYLLIGGGYLSVEELENSLLNNRIILADSVVGENNINSFEIDGKDEKGILSSLSVFIADEMSVNTLQIRHTAFGDSFRLRFVLMGLTDEKKGRLIRFLEEDSRFNLRVFV